MCSQAVGGASSPDTVCTLRDLAALVFERYGTGFPIATVRVTNQPNTYLLLLQGVDDQNVQLKDAIQAYLKTGGFPELRIIGNLLQFGNGNGYRQAELDAVNGLPNGATLIVAGHSMGGIEAQNIVDALKYARPDVRVAEAVSFGAPVQGDRESGPLYLDVKALKGVPDVVALPVLDRGISAGVISINGDTNIDPFDTQHGSHFVYRKSPDLAALGLDGRRLRAGSCLSLDPDSLQSYPVNNTPPPPVTPGCLNVSFRGQPPVSTQNLFNFQGSQVWTQAQAQAWQQATTLREQNVISERIGETGMILEARNLKYSTLLSPGKASNTPQGFDAVYLAPDGTYVIAEAKGGYNGQDLDNILGYGYRCRQGTLEWARRAAERILKSTKTNSQEQQIAQQIRNRIITKGAPVRVEVFQTEQSNGVPGVTKRYITATSP